MSYGDKVTLVDIKLQQQKVAELLYKKKQADDEYHRLTSLRQAASVAQDHAQMAHEEAEQVLKRLGQAYALDLSETCYTPEIGTKP